MRAEKAKIYFTKREKGIKLNCAQAVVKAFKEKFDLEELSVQDFSECGSGKAPGGECGALYVAECLLKRNKEDAGKLRENFLKSAGGNKCEKIRKKGKLSCLGCVENVSEYLEKIADNS